MIRWEERSPDVAALLNPAFISVLIAECCRAYSKECDRRFPFSLAFVAIPICLHPSSRNTFPKNISGKFQLWAEKNAVVRVDFHRRAAGIAASVREALHFGALHNLLKFEEDGCISALKSTDILVATYKETPLHEIMNSIKFFGRWMSRIEDPSIVFLCMGVKP